MPANESAENDPMLTNEPIWISPMLANAGDPRPRLKPDKDTVPQLESWLTAKCPTLDFQQLLTTYNRVEIPWMEDREVLLRLKTTVERSVDAPEEVVMRVLQDLVEKRRAQPESKCEEDEPDTNFYRMFEMPLDLYGICLSLRRGKNMCNLNDAVDRLIPHLFDRIDGRRTRGPGGILRPEQPPKGPEPTKESNRPCVKRAEKSSGVGRSKVQEASNKRRREKETGIVHHRQRRSPRFHKPDSEDRHELIYPVSNPSHVDMSVGDSVLESIETDVAVE